MKSTPILAGCFLATISLAFAGCGKTAQTTNTQNPTSTAETTEQKPVVQDKLAQDTALSNPATVYCLEQGGKFTMSKSFDGSSEGYCTLPSNITCEVWAHYNGDCPVGAKKKTVPTSTTDTKAKDAVKADVASSTVPNAIQEVAEEPKNDNVNDLSGDGSTQGLVIIAEPGEETGEIVTRWKTNGLEAPDGFIVMLSGQEQVSYPTKYFHVLQNPQSRSFVWNDLVAERTYFFRVCIAEGDSCKTYSAVANSLPK